METIVWFGGTVEIIMLFRVETYEVLENKHPKRPPFSEYGRRVAIAAMRRGDAGFATYTVQYAGFNM